MVLCFGKNFKWERSAMVIVNCRLYFQNVILIKASFSSGLSGNNNTFNINFGENPE